jgi:hypothetical protein
MGFLKAKTPPMPPPPPALPELPGVDPTAEQSEMVRQTINKKRKGYSQTILTSSQGVKDEADIYKKTLLGG